MNLRARITLVVGLCFVALAIGLIGEAQRREAALSGRLEEAQVQVLRLSWAGFSGAERQRLLGLMDSFRRAPVSSASISTGSAPGLDRATLAIRSALRSTRFQALRPDGTLLYDTRSTGLRRPLLTPAQAQRIAARAEPVAGLLARPDGGLSYALAAPVFATSGVVGVAVIWSDAAPLLDDLSGTLEAPALVAGPTGGILARGGGSIAGEAALARAVPAAGDAVILRGRGEGIVRLSSVALDDPFSGTPLRLVTLTDVTVQQERRMLVRTVSLVALGSGMLLFFAFLNWSLRTAFRPLLAVIQSLDALTRGRTDLRIRETNRRDEIGRLAGTFETFRQGIEASARLGRLTQELDVAADIQAQCLPRTFPATPGLDFAAAMEPMQEIGGDFYDVFDLPDGRIGFVIADVSDKGVGAALFMAISRTVIRSTAGVARDAADCITRVNAYLCEDNDAMLFVTAIYGILDPRSGAVDLCNAGHNPAVFLSPDGEARLIETEPQPPLGVLEGYAYDGQASMLEPGGRAFLYTDGVTEAMTAAREEFGEARLLALLREAAAERVDASEIVQRVLDAVTTFAAGEPRNDDVTCLAVVRDGSPNRGHADRNTARPGA